MKRFTYKCQYIYFPNWMSVQSLLFIESQFTTDAENILHLNQCMTTHLCSFWMLHNFKGSWAVANGLAGSKMRRWNFCTFLFEIFKCPQRQKSKELQLVELGAVPRKRKVFTDILLCFYEIIFLAWCWEVCPSTLDTSSISCTPDLTFIALHFLTKYVYAYC